MCAFGRLGTDLLELQEVEKCALVSAFHYWQRAQQFDFLMWRNLNVQILHRIASSQKETAWGLRFWSQSVFRIQVWRQQIRSKRRYLCTELYSGIGLTSGVTKGRKVHFFLPLSSCVQQMQNRMACGCARLVGMYCHQQTWCWLF
jgi:hypothetical protein